MDYFYLSKFDLAFDYFNLALIIETIMHGGEQNHTNISKILGHLALINQNRGYDHLALDYFMHALQLNNRFYHHNIFT